MKRKNPTSKVGGNMKTKNIFDEGDESKEQTENFPASTFVKGNLTIIKGFPCIMGFIVIYKGFPYKNTARKGFFISPPPTLDGRFLRFMIRVNQILKGSS